MGTEQRVGRRGVRPAPLRRLVLPGAPCAAVLGGDVQHAVRGLRAPRAADPQTEPRGQHRRLPQVRPAALRRLDPSARLG